MKVLYIGIYNDGSTSKMRAEKIRGILLDWEIDVINTDIPKQKMCRLWQSIGFRYKKGPLIGKVNQYVLENLGGKHYDLIWVDKAIYLTRKTTQVLREHADKLVHYTPDPAFTFHRSRLFYDSMPLYDYMVTTKSFEVKDFIRVMGSKDKVLYVTQGFDKNLHRPIMEWEHKKGVAFIGHYEDERLEAIEVMLQNGIDVTLAGIGWEKFVKSHPSEHLNYLGSGVFGDDYVCVISSSLYAWGSISKWIPEKHTTRTFEIPACKTALLTEKNSEIEEFYADDEVIYYEGITELVEKVKYYNAHMDELKTLMEKSFKKVQTGGFDYESIMRNLLINMAVIV
ncbi:CgeB family protein [Dysgonomonas termitidis]|uniref:Glycosyltransferase n=1 Tax=Dysgonomonas termitidis TaxID=1516126 RepID=A0ABV9KWG1_9BACT